MAVASTMLALGTAAPDFELPDTVTAKTYTLADFAGKRTLVVMFICNHCPYVKHIQAGLAAFGRDYAGRDVAIVGISSNDPESYPDDAPERLAEEARRLGYTFPLLFDETQAVAKAYTAACTPDLFVFDSERRLVYRGQFDGARPSNDIPVTGANLRAAVEAVLAGEPIPEPQHPSIGCGIKWRPGNAPAYAG
jgi:peroxiredoxin